MPGKSSSMFGKREQNNKPVFHLWEENCGGKSRIFVGEECCNSHIPELLLSGTELCVGNSAESVLLMGAVTDFRAAH